MTDHRLEVLGRLTVFGVLPVIVLEDVEAAPPLGDALLAGGLPVAEVTFRTVTAAEVIRRLAHRSGLLVGAGTVTRVAQVDEAVAAGARFVVSPGVSAAVVRRCHELDVPCIPGVATATEIMAARDLGVDTLKLFPAEPLGGLAAVRALGGPFPDVRFVPTGGITGTSAPGYLAEPTVLAVGGSWMVPGAAVLEGRWNEVATLVAAAARIGQQRASREGSSDERPQWRTKRRVTE